MKVKIFPKLFVFTLIVSLLLTAFSGCIQSGQTGITETTKSGEGETTGSFGYKIPPSEIDWTHKGKTPEEILAGDIIRPVPNIKWPLSEKQITLKFLKPLMNYDAEYEKMPILADYEKKTNINIEWTNPPNANFTEQFNLIMSSGTDLPDAIIAPPSADLQRYGQMGVYITLNDIIDNHMPNFTACMERLPDVRRIITSDEGKIYSLPLVKETIQSNDVLIARVDWLEKLGLERPETSDDWYAVFKAFKEKDPNENGKPDEWAFSGYGKNGTGIDKAKSLIWGWGVPGKGFYVADVAHPKDDKVHFAPMEDRYREGLEWVARLYKEGMIDPEILTNDQGSFQAKVLQNTVGAWRGLVNGDMHVLNDSAEKAGDTSFMAREMPIMEGPYGDKLHFDRDPTANPRGMVITNVNKYPAETALWADYWYSDIGRMYFCGIEGLTYELDPATGNYKYTEYVLNNPDGLNVNESRGQITFGRNTWPGIYQPMSVIESMQPQYIADGRAMYRNIDVSRLREPMPTGMSYTKEENDTIKNIMNDLETYVNETTTNFIIGKLPLNDENWNKYIATLKNLKIDEVLKIHNESYERFKNRN